MCKSFESSTSNRTLTVEEYYGAVLLHIEGEGASKGFQLPTETTPALALAILEAALGNNEAISMELAEGLSGLRREVRRVEERDKATREQAELEAEARDFYDVYHSTADWPYQDWVMLEERYKAHFIAVARRAREMRKS